MSLYFPGPEPPNVQWKLLSTKELAEAQKEAMSKPVSTLVSTSFFVRKKLENKLDFS